MDNPTYLGDAVYARWNDDFIVLTTDSHEPMQARNTIYLEREVAQAFFNWAIEIGMVENKK